MNGRMLITFDIPITEECPEGYLLELIANSELRLKSDRWSLRKSDVTTIPIRRGFPEPQEDLD